MKYVMFSEEIVDRLVDFVLSRPIRPFNTQNLNLCYGIFDEESGLYYTMFYHLSDSIMRTGEGFNLNEYAIISPSSISLVSWQEHRGESPNIPLNDKVATFIKENSYYSFSKELAKENPGFSLYRYNEDLKKKRLPKAYL